MPFSIVSPKRSSSCFSTCATRRLVAAQLGIGVAHHAVEVRDQPVEERLLLPELVAVADRAADDPAQHVAAALAAGDHAVDDQERARADVIGDHAQAGRQVVLRAGLAHRGADQVLEEVDLVVGVHVLQHRRQPLEAHAGVDRRLRQRVQHALVVAVELHEHEIPDLDVAVALGFRRSGRAAPDLGAVVVEDLRARSARAGVGHLPEVVARVLARPCCRRCACSAPPERRSPSSRCRTPRRRRCRRSSTAFPAAVRTPWSAAPTNSGSRRA